MVLTETYEKQIAEILRELGLAEIIGERKPIPEAARLVSVGHDIYGREQRLVPPAASAWDAMKQAAGRDGVLLQMVSAFRSVAYQRQIIERKLGAGQTIGQILRVSAAPGYSEHHNGRTIDLTSPGCKPLTEEFDQTPGFAWLVRHANRFGFSMTYPRNNPAGVIYEPWHWTLAETKS